MKRIKRERKLLFGRSKELSKVKELKSLCAVREIMAIIFFGVLFLLGENQNLVREEIRKEIFRGFSLPVFGLAFGRITLASHRQILFYSNQSRCQDL